MFFDSSVNVPSSTPTPTTRRTMTKGQYSENYDMADRLEAMGLKHHAESVRQELRQDIFTKGVAPEKKKFFA